MDFGSQLRAWRLEADLSLRDVARKVKIDYTQLSKIETGTLAPPPDDRIRDLVAAVDRPASDAEILIGLARESNVPTGVVRAALIKNPEVGALLRSIKERRLSPEEAAEIKRIATKGRDGADGPAAD